MPGRILNFTENPVNWAQTDESNDVITISGLEASDIRKVTFGTGLFYFYDEGWNSQLSFVVTNPLSLTSGPGQIELRINRLTRFPFTGIVTIGDEGYLVAPTLKLEYASEASIVLMRLSPRTVPHAISIDKPVLSIEDQSATVSLSMQGSRLRCTGIISKPSFEAAKLIINRNPNLPVYKSGYDEEICKLTVPGEFDATWTPVIRGFDDSLIVFYLSSIGPTELGKIATLLGAPEYDPLDERIAMVIGDGPFTNYHLQLVVSHRLHTSSDEVCLRIE